MKSLIVAAAAMVLGTALGFLICGATVRHLRQRVRTLRRQTKTGPPKKMGVMDKVLIFEAVILIAYTVADLAVFWHTGAEPYTLTDALRLFCTEILTAEDGNGRAEGIKRAHAELLQAHTGREARNVHAAETVVRRLHDHAADGRDGGLKSHGDAHDDEVTDGFGIRFAVCAGKREERHAEADIDEAQNAADRLRCDGGDRRARNAPLEDNDAEQVKTDIQDGRDGEEQERRAAVTDGAQDAGEQIV